MSNNGEKDREEAEQIAALMCKSFELIYDKETGIVTAECKPLGLRREGVRDVDAFDECEDCIGYDPGITDKGKIRELQEWLTGWKKTVQAKEEQQ